MLRGHVLAALRAGPKEWPLPCRSPCALVTPGLQRPHRTTSADGGWRRSRCGRLVLGYPQIFLFERPPAGGADGILAFLEGGEDTLDAGRVPVLSQCRQHLLRSADRGAVGLRRIDAEPKAHRPEFAGRHHRGLAAFEDVDERR